MGLCTLLLDRIIWLPFCPLFWEKKWIDAGGYGAVWGVGHGISTSMMGLVGFAVRGSLVSFYTIPSIDQWTNLIVGLTLVLIGWMGSVEARLILKQKIDKCNSSSDQLVDTEELPVSGSESLIQEQKVLFLSAAGNFPMMLAIFFNGCLLGFSWDGLPSLSPTIGIDSFDSLVVFLVAYCIGTALAISFACGVIGEITLWVGKSANESLPAKLAWTTSILAICIGGVWVIQSLFFLFCRHGREGISDMEEMLQNSLSKFDWIQFICSGFIVCVVVGGFVVSTTLTELGVVVSVSDAVRSCHAKLSKKPKKMDSYTV